MSSILITFNFIIPIKYLLVTDAFSCTKFCVIITDMVNVFFIIAKERIKMRDTIFY